MCRAPQCQGCFQLGACCAFWGETGDTISNSSGSLLSEALNSLIPFPILLLLRCFLGELLMPTSPPVSRPLALVST